MNDYSLPEHVFEKLKCKLCDGYLSVSPISGSTGSYTCGRCDPSADTNELYEELARHLSFPCSYESCKIKISWNDVGNHEKICPHRTITCPVCYCEAKLETRMVFSHFNTSHEEFKHSDNVKGDVLKLKSIYVPLERVHFVDFKKSYYLVFIRLNNHFVGNSLRYQLTMGVFSLCKNDNQHVQYQVVLELQSSKETSKMAKQHLEILPYNDKIHCYQCLNRECTIKGHTNAGDFLTTKFTGLDPSNNMCLSYSIKLYDPAQVTSSRETPTNVDLALQLECPICSIYMCAPIYNCSKGHSICATCRKSIQICPLCKTKMEDSRNYTLEQISETVKIPCHNSEGLPPTDFNTYFCNIAKDIISALPDINFDPLTFMKNIPTPSSSSFLEPVTENEVHNAMLLKNSAASDIYELNSRIFKEKV
ncbi:hypothetical protein JTB14_016029 [Gonioctena quinquepunctata]|nr:hypothetical protein JTB14_016029 [Gonioctena quinquepunctata]